MPAHVPPDWHVHCVFVEPSHRPQRPAEVSVQYGSGSGHESVHISQTAAADRSSIYEELTRGEGWDGVIRDGTVIHVAKPGTTGHQAQAHLERDGTFVFLMSETLTTTEQLTNIASSLVPAPNTSSI